MHELIAAPFLGEYFLLRPGAVNGVKLPRAQYEELASVPTGLPCPKWMTDAAREAFGLNIAGRRLAEAVMVRRWSALGYSRASYELNLGCNWDCEHCYLGLKQFRGLAWDQREELLHTIRDAGVVYLQLTGGEPLIDRLFCETYELAWRLGMMLHISTNGSRLHNPRILELLATCPPYRITVSAYGATEASYDALVRRPGAFRLFSRGMAAALEAGLPLRLLAIAEACWPEGLQPGQGDPVILELDPAEADLPRLEEIGYEVFTSVDSLRGYVYRRNQEAAGIDR